VNGTIASTTDTAGDKERKTADFTALESNKYECDQINFDFHLTYKRSTCGRVFRTSSAVSATPSSSVRRWISSWPVSTVPPADTSDRSKNPMLQDVAVGWLQKYRNEAPARVMSKITDEDGKVISAVIRGKNGDYENLDALVMDVPTT
jgi:hypothetical protein